MPQSLLDVADLSVRFGGLLALDGVGLEVGEGELVGLIGPNGAGKTTLLDAVTGFESYRGRITFAGTALQGRSPRERVRLGMARTFQSLDLFEDLTVRENLLVAAEVAGGGSSPNQRVEGVLQDTGLADRAGCLAAALPHALRRQLGLARALATGARLVLVDEPAAGLDVHQTEALGEQLARVARAGTAVVLVDHNMGLVLKVCHRMLVLDAGRLIAQGSPAEVRNDSKVIAAYLGPPAKAGSG